MPRHPRWLLHFFAFALLFAGSAFRAEGAGADRLVNISARSQVGTGDNVMIAGFVVGPGNAKRVLIRAVGPTLASAGLTGVLADPVLTLYDSTGKVIASNDNWSSSDSDAMTAVGASPIPVGSADSVLVATVASGNYTAIVTGSNNTTGIALVEVYEIDGASRLINLSARAQVGSGNNILIAGMVVAAGTGPRHILLRALGPTLKNFQVTGALNDPKLTVYNSSGTVIATNDNWSDDNKTGVDAATATAGAVGFAAGSKDSALVLDLPAGAYTAQVSSVDSTTGIALIEAYDITTGSTVAPPMLSVSATTANTSVTGLPPAIFTLTRTGDISAALSVPYKLGGSAVSDMDYVDGSAGTATFAAGSATATVSITVLPTAKGGTKTVLLTLLAPAGYDVGNDTAQVAIYTDPGTLYLANLRTSNGASSSTAYGTSTLLLSSDESALIINLSFSNLSSGETEVHLRLNDGSTDGVYLTKLPAGQLVSTLWTIKATSGYTVPQIVAALKAGNLYVSVDTVNFPGGELAGAYVAASGSQVFTAPPAPPTLPAGLPTATDAARFLTQATFGPTKADIDSLTQTGFDPWITNQMAIAQSSHRTETVADFNAYTITATTTKPTATDRQEAWWKIAVTGPDQLRQRVAFALSELFVISDQNGTVNNWEEGAANYEDLLANDAFGNFRTLLQDVTLSPMMGVYLTSIKNSKATSTTEPDENYAREVMQLFTVGLNLLQPDGSLKLDATGLPIPSYDQTTVTQMAQVFTGWQFHNATPTKSNFRSGGSVIDDYIQPMTLNALYHEDAAKTIIGGVSVPAGEGGAADLKIALDALFNHPNLAPFVSRQLIERLVTSNPSPGYIYRVAQVFANNGSGVRGDLAAVVRAILTDYEARSTQVAALPTAGKLKEPLLRVTALLRAFAGGSDNGRFNIPSAYNSLAEASLQSTTVFNFFDPDYVVPGSLASAGLYAPEFQILTATTAISVPNNIYSYVTATRSATTIGLNYSSLPATNQPSAVVDQLNLVLCANSMPATLHDRIVAALTALPTSTADVDRYRTAIYLVATTQSASIQK